MALHIGCVTSRAELDALRAELDSLWTSIEDRTPFQHAAWIFAWWDVFGQGEPRVVTFREHGSLVGVLPLYILSSELRLIGAGLSDYLDMLAEPRAAGDVLRALPVVFEHVLPEWTFCGLDHLRPGSLLLKFGDPRNAGDERREEEPTVVMRLPSSMDALMKQIGPKLSGNIRYRHRRAERMDPVMVERASAATLHDDLETLFALHGTRWTCRGERGVLADERVRAFHRSAAAAMDRAGLLRIWKLRIGAKTVAVQYGFQVGDRAYLYIGGFDPALSTISPGTLSTVALIEHAIAEGAATLDFLAGREAYKYSWRATDRPRFSRHLRRS